MRKFYAGCYSFIILVCSLVTFTAKSQVTVSTAVPGNLLYNSATADGAIVFGVRNTNSYSITITSVSNYLPSGLVGSLTLWSHTTVTGAPTSISLANGWTSVATGSVNTSSAGVTPIFQNISLVIPANTTIRLAISGPPNSPFYAPAYTIANYYTSGGVEIYTQDNVNSPGYGGAFPGPPANTPRGFIGSISFRPTTSAVANNAGAFAISSPSDFCKGSHDVKVKIVNNGNNIINTVQVNWELDGILQSPVAYSSPIDVLGSPSGNEAIVTLGNVTFANAARTIRVWTSLPNGVADPVSADDQVQTSMRAKFGGTYTIGPSGDFTTLSAAATALGLYGVCSATTFNVTNATYNEQVSIPPIAGVSASNTVTFNGNGSTISFNSSTSAARAGITLQGADYVTIDNFIINGSAGTYAWGVLLMGTADRNTISNCTINVSTSNTTSGNHIGIVINGSPSATASSNNNGNNNTFINNTINGGYYGIYMYGNSAAGSQNTGNIISKNQIKDVYGYSVYMLYQNGAVVDSNEITRPLRTSALSAGAGIYLTTGNLNCTVKRNRIHNMFDGASTSTSTLYSIYLSSTDAIAGSENKVINNLIYNIGGNATIYGIYNTGSPYMQAYHNTIVLNDAVATTGTAYGLYQTTAATGIDYKNNLVWVSRSGTGVKRCVYFVTTTSTITSNNNLLLMTAASGTDNKLGQFGTTSYTDLAAWKGANSGAYDQQSVSTNPLFSPTANTSGDFTPTESSLDGIGANVGVTNDILNRSRTTTPDPGAFEMVGSVGTDIKPQALVSPAISAKGCYNNETITVSIKNNDASSTIDFSLKPVTVTVNVTGATTASYSAIVNSGTLASNATTNVTMATPGSTLNMSAIGTYNLSITTSVAGDLNTGNDNMMVSLTKEALAAGTMSISQTNYCATGTPQLTSTGATGYSSLQWQSTTTSGSNYVNVAGGTVTPFTVPSAISQTTFYRLVATCGVNNDPTGETEVTVNNPQVLTVTNGSRCGPGTVDLQATTGASDLKWYAASTGGTALGSGNVFTTPTINSTTTYYVAAVDGGGQSYVGRLAPVSGSGTVLSTYGQDFTVTQGFTLNSVDVISTTGTAITVSLYSAGGTTQLLTTNSLTLPTNTTSTISLNWVIAPGTYRICANAMTGNFIRENSSVTYPFALGSVGQVNGFVSSITGAVTTSASYYWFYNWSINTGCEGTRTPVTATITPAPALTVTASKTICNNTVHTLAVTSNVGDFNNYTWSPQTDLYINPGGTVPYTGGNVSTVYVKTTTSAAVTYTLSSLNSTTQCSGSTTSIVTTLPVPTITSSIPSICASGSALLSLDPATTYGANAGLQWQSSINGVSYNNISSANSSTYNTGTITQTTYYKLVLKDQAGVTCTEPTYILTVNNPQVLTATGATRCGTGTVDLLATTAASNLNWYSASTGGTPIGSGNVFTTPTINSTTTFYVAAAEGGQSQTSAMPATLPNVSTTTYGGLVIDVNQALVLASVNVFSINGGSVSVELRNSAGALVAGPVSFPLIASTYTNPQNLQLNFSIPPGTGYRLLATPTAALAYQGGTYPLQLGNNVGTIVNGAVGSGTTTSTLNYYFYNLETTTGCEGTRTPVIATVTSPAALTSTASKTICNDAVHSLAVTSNLSDYNSYVWSPQTNLFTDAAATIPYTGGNATQVYVKSSTAAATTYTVTSNNSSNQCANVATSVVTIMPSPSINATVPEICISGTSTLSLSASTGYGAGTIQWQQSPTNSAYTDIGSATNTSYTTPTLTQTTYYKALIKDQAGATCNSAPTYTLTVNNPQVTATTPASRCGTGTVTLGATATPGAALSWYAASSGGTSLGTGTSFTTPSISTTNTYYVAANNGGSTSNMPSPTIGTSLFITTTAGWGLRFTVNNPVTINSVTVSAQGSTAGPASIQIKITDLNDVVLYTGTLYNFTVGTALANYVVPVNISVPAGNYKMGMTYTGLSNMVRESTGVTFPYTSSGGEVSITAGANGSGTAQTTSAYYWFYNWVISTGCESSRTAVIATVTPTSSNAAGSVGATECVTKTISGSTEFNYTDCDRIALLSPSGGSPVSGNVDACVKIDAAVQTAPTGEPFVQRHYDITPATNATTATSTVTLYFLQSEFNAFNAARGSYAALPTNSSDATGKANLKITQYKGTGTAPGNYTGAVTYIDPFDASIVWNSIDNRWEITFSATGGGAFYVHTGNYVLPVTIVNFRGEQSGTTNKLFWSTSTETNNKGFELERSADGMSYSLITFVASKADRGNSTTAISYGYDDSKALAGANYYRLKQIDNDGKYNYSNVVVLTRKVTSVELTGVYPNPATRELNVKIVSPQADKLTLVITDLTGKAIMQQPMSVIAGDNQKQLNVSSLAAGTYVIKAICANGCETTVHKFVKQ